MKPNRPHSYDEDARALTLAMRTSDKPEWVAVREFLTGAGFEPERSAVGDLFPEQSGDFGVLVTPDRKVFTFEVGWETVRGDPTARRYWVMPRERTNAGERYAYAPSAFAAMTLLENEQPSGVRPLDLLVEFVAVLTDTFRDTAKRTWSDRWRAEDYWSVLHEFLRGRSIEPMKTVALDWSVSTALEIRVGLVGLGPRFYFFAGSLETINGPIEEVTTWEELDESAARSLYGDLVDAGIELLGGSADNPVTP